MSRSLRRFEKSTKYVYYLKNDQIRVRKPPAVRKIQKIRILFEKGPNPGAEASGGSENPENMNII